MPINGRDSARNDEIDVQRPITSKTFNPLLAVKFRRDGARPRVCASALEPQVVASSERNIVADELWPHGERRAEGT